MTDIELHGIGMRLTRVRWTPPHELSDGQEYLFDAVVSELEYRQRRVVWPETKCTCALCFSPFPFYDLEDASEEGREEGV